ncbi:hypothetical protein, partial [Dyella japonica]
IFFKIGNLLYGEIQLFAARILRQAVQVSVGGALESLAYMAGALMVGLIARRRGFVYGAAIPVVVQACLYVWYGPMGHTNIPPELRERYPYPFWLYFFPIFAWVIQTGIGGVAGVLLAKWASEGAERNRYRFLLAAALVIPQVAAWCYLTHAIMWGSDSYPLQTIEFIPATIVFLLVGYASIRNIIKNSAPLPSTA